MRTSSSFATFLLPKEIRPFFCLSSFSRKEAHPPWSQVIRSPKTFSARRPSDSFPETHGSAPPLMSSQLFFAPINSLQALHSVCSVVHFFGLLPLFRPTLHHPVSHRYPPQAANLSHLQFPLRACTLAECSSAFLPLSISSPASDRAPFPECHFPNLLFDRPFCTSCFYDAKALEASPPCYPF